MSNSTRQVIYRVEYPCTNLPPPHGTPSSSTTVVEIGKDGTALDVMTAAADQDSKYNFQTTYDSNKGYDINGIGKTKNGSGFWNFYYKIPTLSEVPSPLRVSSVVIPGNAWEIIMRYEKESTKPKVCDISKLTSEKKVTAVPMGGHTVAYQVEFPDATTESTVVQIAKGSTALDVMAAAADQDTKFNFQATYYGNSGYFTDAIGGVSAASGSFYWSFFYENLETTEETSSTLGVSNVAILGNGWKIIQRAVEIKQEE